MEVTQMVTNRIQLSAGTPVKQGSAAAAPESNKINASTPFDFSGKEPDSIRRPVASGHHVGEAWLSGLAGKDGHGEAAHQSNERLPVPRSEEHTSELQSLRHLVCR